MAGAKGTASGDRLLSGSVGGIAALSPLAGTRRSHNSNRRDHAGSHAEQERAPTEVQVPGPIHHLSQIDHRQQSRTATNSRALKLPSGPGTRQGCCTWLAGALRAAHPDADRLDRIHRRRRPPWRPSRGDCQAPSQAQVARNRGKCDSPTAALRGSRISGMNTGAADSTTAPVFLRSARDKEHCPTTTGVDR